MTPGNVPEDHGPCCAASCVGSPQNGHYSAPGPRTAEVALTGTIASSGMVHLEGGEFLMGTADPYGLAAEGEGSVRAVMLKPFWIDNRAVANAQFAAFVEATGYITDAERYGWSSVFGGLLPDDFEPARGAAKVPLWRQVFGATWRQPKGLHSSVDNPMDHPVVHVSWSDTASYCSWSGMRLCRGVPVRWSRQDHAGGGIEGAPQHALARGTAAPLSAAYARRVEGMPANVHEKSEAERRERFETR